MALPFSVRCFLFPVILLVSFFSAFAQEGERALTKADSLFKQYELGASHSLYSAIGHDTLYGFTSRSTAYRKLAEQDWKFYTNYDDAMNALQLAAGLRVNPSGLFLLRASILTDVKKYDQAILYADKSIRFSASEAEKTAAGLGFAQAVRDAGFAEQNSTDQMNQQIRPRALAILNDILIRQPGSPEASELLIGLGILLKDGETILKGWRSYYIVNEEKEINDVLKKGFSDLKPVLQSWKGRSLSIHEMVILAEGFAETRFFNYAGYFAKQVKKKDPAVYFHSKGLQDIIAYTDYLQDIRDINNIVYPAVARGLKNYEHRYDSLIDSAGLKLWNRLSFTKAGEKYDADSLYDRLNRNYQTEGYIGTTVNYYGMLMGHTVHKELKQIDQYGYHAAFTYKSVDRLFSRDFTSWYGTTNVGGWGDSTTILQVRKAYMSEPFTALSWMTDSAARRQILLEIENKKKSDLIICRADQYAEPRFLAGYLKYQEASKIYSRMKKEGLTGMNLNIGFIAEILKLTITSTVFAHEGRHAIDQLYFPEEFKSMSDDERELRAKYSEIIFSLDPKMACTGSIFGSDLDENTNHGKANKRLRVMMADWMTAHENEIKGLDEHIPLLMQFDLLTNEQIITICKLNDPLALKIKHS